MEDLVQAELSVTRMGQKLNVSVFILDGLLIDTGPYRKHDELSALFEQSDISEVVLTHHHEDHTGMAYWFEEREVPIYMHHKGIDLCEKKAKLPIYRQVFWGKRPPFKAEPVSDIFRTPEYTWETIYTPGHADDHIALYNREKGWMFGGDLFVMPKPKSMYRFESLPTLIRSLRKVLTYNFDVYIDSHAGILPDGKKRLQEKLRYLIQVQQEVLFLYNEGTSVSKIRKKLFPERHFMHYVSLFENSPKHMIRSIIHQH